MMHFTDTEDEVCLLMSEEEVDTGNNNILPKLPSYLAILDEKQTPRGSEAGPGKVEVITGSRTVHKQRCCTGASCFTYRAAGLSAIGGLLFGYDVGIVSGAILQVKVQFLLTCFQQELVVSSMLLGAIFASCVGGFLVDYFGRKRSIIFNSLLFTTGALVLGFSPNFTSLIVGRLVLGFSVALSVIAECVYISEISPPKRRGFLVSLNEIGIVVGFLLAYIVNFACIEISYGWRLMFGLSAVPALIQGIGMCFLPESPRFLLLRQQELQARQVLELLYDGAMVEVELDAMKSAIQEEKSHSILDLFRSKDNMRYRMFIGMSLVFLQQFTGQPNVLYYAPTVFQSVGFHTETAATLATIGLGVAKVLSCLLALVLLDHVGRRKLFIFGAIIMTLSISAVGFVALATPKFVFTSPCTDVNDTLYENVTSQNGKVLLVTTLVSTTTHTVKPSTVKPSTVMPPVIPSASPKHSVTPSTSTTVTPTTTVAPTTAITSPSTTPIAASTTPTTSTAATTTTTTTTFLTTTTNLEVPITTTVNPVPIIKVLSTSSAESENTSEGEIVESFTTSAQSATLVPLSSINPVASGISNKNTQSTTISSKSTPPHQINNTGGTATTKPPNEAPNLPTTKNGHSEMAKHKNDRKDGGGQLSSTTNNPVYKRAAPENDGVDENGVDDNGRLETAKSKDSGGPEDGGESTNKDARFIKWSSVVLLMCYVVGFELGFGTGTWLILAEIFPSAVRGRAIAIATVFNWGTNLLVSLTFLDVLKTLGIAGTFLPYAVICGLSVFFLCMFVPETKGRSLEEVGQDLNNSSPSQGVQKCCPPCCKRSSGAYHQIATPNQFLLDDIQELHESD